MRLIHVIRVSLHCVLCMHSYRYSGHQANLCRYTPQSCALQVVVCYESMWIYVCISVFEFVLLLTAGSMRCKVSLVVSCHFGSEPPQPDFFTTHPHLRANGGSGEAGRSIHCVEPAPLLRAGSGGGRGGRSIVWSPLRLSRTRSVLTLGNCNLKVPKETGVRASGLGRCVGERTKCAD